MPLLLNMLILRGMVLRRSVWSARGLSLRATRCHSTAWCSVAAWQPRGLMIQRYRLFGSSVLPSRLLGHATLGFAAAGNPYGNHATMADNKFDTLLLLMLTSYVGFVVVFLITPFCLTWKPTALPPHPFLLGSRACLDIRG